MCGSETSAGAVEKKNPPKKSGGLKGIAVCDSPPSFFFLFFLPGASPPMPPGIGAGHPLSGYQVLGQLLRGPCALLDDRAW